MTNIENTTYITRNLVPDNQRMQVVDDLFGIHFPQRIEPLVFALAEEMGHEYRGGLWKFYTLSNGGFYMSPDFDGLFNVSCENGFNGPMSADALGITACLYTYSHLSFTDNEALAELCARHYHWLRDFMLEHAEVRNILAAID
jgi:hypothetical protein